MSFHLLLFPLYVKSVPGNAFQLRTDLKFTIAVILGTFIQAYLVWKSALTPEWMSEVDFVNFMTAENQNSYKRTFDQ